MALQAFDDHGPVPLVDLDELPDDGLVMPCGGRRRADRVDREDRQRATRAAAARAGRGAPRPPGRRADVVRDRRLNGLLPITWAAGLGLPLVDADGMGRAFPEVQQATMHIAGIPPGPVVLTDERGNIARARTRRRPSGPSGSPRCVAVELGRRVARRDYMLTVAQARTATVIAGSVSLRARHRRARCARPSATRSPRSPPSSSGARPDRRQGHRRRAPHDRRVRPRARPRRGPGRRRRPAAPLEIQNENLIALEDGEVRASVPDLITVLDPRRPSAVTTELLRYGQRVTRHRVPVRPGLADASAGSSSPGRVRSATTSTTSRGGAAMHAAPMLDLRLGIDVGGTNTDAVVLDARRPAARQGQGADHARRDGGIAAGDRRPCSTASARSTQPRSRTSCSARPTPRTPCSSAATCGASRSCRIGGPATHAVRRCSAWPRRPARGDLGRRGDRPRRHRVRRPRDRPASTPTPCGASSRRWRARSTPSRSRACSRPSSAAHELAARGGRARGAAATCTSRSATRSARSACSSARTPRCSTRRCRRRRPGRGRAAERARRTRARAGDVLRAERRHADGARLRAPHTRCSRSAAARRTACAAPRYLTGMRGRARRRRRRHLDRHRRARAGLPARVLRRRSRSAASATNFRMPDLVSIALGGGTIVARRTTAASRIGPAQRRLSLTERGARLRRRDAHADRRRRGRRPRGARRAAELARPTPLLAARSRARTCCSPTRSTGSRPRAATSRSSSSAAAHPRARRAARRERGAPSRALRGRQRDRRRHRVGQRPGRPHPPPSTAAPR